MFDELADPNPPTADVAALGRVQARAGQIRRRRRVAWAAPGAVAAIVVVVAVLVWSGREETQPVITTPTTSTPSVSTSVPATLEGVDLRGEQLSLDAGAFGGTISYEQVFNEPGESVFERTISIEAPTGAVVVSRFEAPSETVAAFSAPAASPAVSPGGRRYLVDPAAPGQVDWLVEDTILVRVLTTGAIDPVAVLDAVAYTAPVTRCVDTDGAVTTEVGCERVTVAVGPGADTATATVTD